MVRRLLNRSDDACCALPARVFQLSDRRQVMLKTSLLIAALVLFTATNLRAAQTDSDLQQIADALDVSTTKTFQFTANGFMFSLGQNTSPAAAWPRQFVKSMTRTYDFTTGSMRDEMVRMSGETVAAGPEQRVVQLVYGG